VTLRPAISEHDHVAGRADAPLTLVEYGDYQCPHCAAADLVVRALQGAFGAELRFAFRNFPLTEVHPAAEPAAELAESAALQGKFWEAHHALFAWSRENGPETLGLEAFEAIALTLGLDPQRIEEDVGGHRHLERIRNDFSSGVRSGVNGTPTFFINGQRFDGPPAVKDLTAALKAVLSARR
jgi:protein-disulfide isomerase